METSKRDWFLFGAFIALFPVSWPMMRLVNALRLQRLRSARRLRGEWAIEDVRTAHAYVRMSHTMASGWEENERMFELVLRDGQRVGVIDDVGAVERALRISGIPIREHVVKAPSVGSVFGWMYWAGSSALIWAIARA